MAEFYQWRSLVASYYGSCFLNLLSYILTLVFVETFDSGRAISAPTLKVSSKTVKPNGPGDRAVRHGSKVSSSVSSLSVRFCVMNYLIN